MEFDKNRLKEPGMVRVLLGALALGCAVLIGFVAGLRVGDRIGSKPDRPETPSVGPSAWMDTIPEIVVTAVPDTVTVEPKTPSFSKQQIAQGVEYLASHNRWNRDEMEKIPVLEGLWDAIDHYRTDDIRRYNDLLVSTPLTSIVEGLEQNPKQGYYAAKGDKNITLSTYIKRLR